MDQVFTKLLEQARDAAKLAHAPYSKFHVGAAVLTEKGVYTGANIENACTNLGICAERVAISHARMHGASEISHIAVFCSDVAPGAPLSLSMPCGACRQWLVELAPNALLLSNGSNKVYQVSDLLPQAFSLPQ